MSTIVLQEVSRTFRRADGGPLLVLDRVSFTVREGEFLCLLGPSGSGKSITLNLIAGLLPPSGGEILLDGRPLRQTPLRYGYVFQQPRLFPWRTVEENLRFALRAETGRRVQGEEERIQAVLDLVNLAEYRHYYPHQISGGMQHRVAVARAYCREPALLLMDEPFSSLDEITARHLRAELVQTWMKNRVTVLFVTHDITEAAYLADRVLLYTPKPTRVAREIPVGLPRPRRYGSAELFEVERVILEAFEETMVQHRGEKEEWPSGP
ncbi:MAG: ABC transporter ATP-binding protein [Deltaproteobacteria bacterium]|nr:ABC transporter ATP-binding protein [Deltaproteobacteria bacterium]